MRLLLLMVGVTFSLGLPRAEAQRTYVIKHGVPTTTKFGKKRRAKKFRKRGKLKLVRLESGEGFVLADPKISWGTRLAVYNLTRVMARYRLRFPKASPVIINDLSKRGGGPLANHNSHMDGRDVDIPLILNRVEAVSSSTPRTINAAQNWFIVLSLVNSCDVEYIFVDRKVQEILFKHARLQGISAKTLGLILQYPSTSAETIVRHWPGHIDHLHVRFRHERAKTAPSSRRYCERHMRSGLTPR